MTDSQNSDSFEDFQPTFGAALAVPARRGRGVCPQKYIEEERKERYNRYHRAYYHRNKDPFREKEEPTLTIVFPRPEGLIESSQEN